MDASAKKLCDRIVADARARAAEIVEEARAAATETLEQAETEARRNADEYLHRAREHAARDAERLVSVGQLDLRNEELALKQDLLGCVFDEALQRLKDMPAEEYGRLLSSMIIDANPQGVVQLQVAEADRSRIGDELVDALNQELKSRGMGSVQFGGYIDSIDAGFILKEGAIALNFSFDDILSDLRETMESEIASLLFESQV